VVSNQVQNSSTSAGPRGRKSKAPQAPAAHPLQIGDQNVLPSVTRVFRTDQNLYAYLESYAPANSGKSTGGSSGAAGASAGSPPSSVALVFFRGGAKISEAGPFPGVAEKSGAVRYFVKIPLQKFPSGRYWMQVNVLDPAADQVAFARVPLAIRKFAGVAPAAGPAPSGR